MLLLLWVAASIFQVAAHKTRQGQPCTGANRSSYTRSKALGTNGLWCAAAASWHIQASMVLPNVSVFSPPLKNVVREKEENAGETGVAAGPMYIGCSDT